MGIDMADRRCRDCPINRDVILAQPSLKKKSEESKDAKDRKPFLNCPNCKRRFGTASLPIHLPHCIQKQQREQEKTPNPIKPESIK